MPVPVPVPGPADRRAARTPCRDRAADPRLSRADARKDRVQAMLAHDPRITAAAVAEAEGISVRQAHRIINSLES